MKLGVLVFLLSMIGLINGIGGFNFLRKKLSKQIKEINILADYCCQGSIESSIVLIFWVLPLHSLVPVDS